MILQALTRYYEDLLAQGKIDAPGWAPAKISFALYLDETGELTQRSEERRVGKECGGKAHSRHCVELFVGQFLLFARYRPKGQTGAQPRLFRRGGAAAPRSAGWC